MLRFIFVPFAQLTLKQVREIERCALKSRDFGQEVLGIFRVPLYTMEDEYCGLPAFFNNNFIGAAKSQLREGLRRLGIMKTEEVDAAITASALNRPDQPERVVVRKMSSVSPPITRIMNPTTVESLMSRITFEDDDLLAARPNQSNSNGATSIAITDDLPYPMKSIKFYQTTSAEEEKPSTSYNTK